MKKEIRLMLEYQCYPIWIYDEYGKFIDNNLVEEIKNDKKMLNMLLDIQEKFDSLYLDNHVEFKYIGFSSDTERSSFQEMLHNVYNNLCSLLNEKYNIVNMVDIIDM